jgi:hypothetical protein
LKIIISPTNLAQRALNFTNEFTQRTLTSSFHQQTSRSEQEIIPPANLAQRPLKKSFHQRTSCIELENRHFTAANFEHRHFTNEFTQ